MDSSVNLTADASRVAGLARKSIYVIWNDLLNPVVESQVYRPLSLQARRNGDEVQVVAIMPLGWIVRTELRNEVKKRQKAYYNKYGINTYFVVGGPSRMSCRPLQVRLLRWYLKRKRNRAQQLIVFGRNCRATTLILDAICNLRSTAHIIYDCRGDDAYEYLGELGIPAGTLHIEASVKRKFIRLIKLQKRACDADQIIVVSRAMGKMMSKRHEVPLSKMLIRPCAVDLEVFRTPDREKARKRLGLGDQLVVCYLGSLAWYQLPDQAIRVFQLIKSQRTDALFLGITTEPQKLGRMLEEAGVRTEDFRVIAVTSRDVARFLPAADLGLLLRERSPVNAVASPIKFAEYLACGVPVLISEEIGDYSKLVNDSLLGGVVDIEKDDETLGSLVISIVGRITSDPSCRRRARQFAKRHLTLVSLA